MRVKMLNSRVGVTETYDGGQEYDLPKARALRWVAGGMAVLVDGVTTVEQAVIEPVAEVAIEKPVVELAIDTPVVETATKKYRRRK